MLSEDSKDIIYVAGNNSADGDGSFENPFKSLDLACSNITEYHEKLTINIFEGEYYIDSNLKFNTSNLVIKSINGGVVLKNFNNDAKVKTFSLVSSSGNFTMSNVIFDASNWSQRTSRTCYFTPFESNYATVIFDDCTFRGYNNDLINILPFSNGNSNRWDNAYNNYIFNNCKFNISKIVSIGAAYKSNVTFNYCIFPFNYSNNEGAGLLKAENVIFDSCWFGVNDLTENGLFAHIRQDDPGVITLRTGMTNGLYKFTRYAIFNVNENYLGNNTYEIIGQLMWNDSTIDDIDKLGPMTVYLYANNGNIQNTAVLENGYFKINYTGESDNHQITVVLDDQTMKLDNNINFTLKTPIINYGDNFNITVSFPCNVKGTLYVTVNNKTYPKKYIDNQNSTFITVDNNLPKGDYNVDVTFVKDKNVVNQNNYPYFNAQEIHSFGFDSTTISVLGKGSSLITSPVTTNYNVTKELVATLTDVNGNPLSNKPIQFVVGTIDKTLNTTSDGKVSVDVSGLVPDSYIATISFAGDECYDEFSTTANVIINKVVPNVSISPEGDLVPGKKLAIKVEMPYATENVTIIVNGDKNTTKLVDNAATYTIEELVQGTYYVTVLYAGDELCDFAYATDSFDVVKSTTDLINELNQTVVDKDAKIGELNQTVVDKDAKIGELNQTCS